MTSPEDDQLLERLRRSGIRIDRNGELWHEGEVVRHEGLRRALFRWLERLPPPDGRYVFRLDQRRFAFVEVEDTPLVVRALRWQQGGDAQLSLSDGSQERLDPTALDIDEDGILRCHVRHGRLEARLATSAAAVLAERIDATAEPPRLGAGGSVVTISRRAPRS